MDVGVYFYTQAVTKDEAIEEANYVLDLIRPYKVTILSLLMLRLLKMTPSARKSSAQVSLLT